jgi:hypothetical protein
MLEALQADDDGPDGRPGEDDSDATPMGRANGHQPPRAGRRR